MEYVYVPGCALMLYKPQLAEKLKQYIEAEYGAMETLLTCCFKQQALKPETCIITPCSTCDKRYKSLYKDCSTVYFLDVLAHSDSFPFPDYGGVEMSIQDTCSGRTDEKYLHAIRLLLERMNIRLVEAERSGKRGKCCGQVFYGKLPVEKVEEKMRERAQEMPCEDVVVYCSSCIQSMSVGGKRPRFIIDLLFGEPTEVEQPDIVLWNKRLLDFRAKY